MMRSRSRKSDTAPERLREPARDEEPLRLPRRRRELDARGPTDAALASVRELLLKSIRLLDSPAGLGGARLRPLAQPLDLAADGIGERLLVGGLPAEELVAAGEKLAVAAVRLEHAVAIRAVELEDARGHVLEEVAIVAHDEERARCPPPADLRARGCHPRRGGWSARPSAGCRARSRARARSPGACAIRRRARRRRPARRGPRGRGRVRCGPGARSSSARPGPRRSRPRRCRPRGTRGPAARTRCGHHRGRSACRGRARRSPPGSWRSVDLPDPLGPTRPAWSPSKSPNDSPSNRLRAP